MSLCASEEVKGFYFVYFWSLYMSAQIFGNLTGGIMIKETSGPEFFFFMAMVMIITMLGFICLIMPKPHKEELAVKSETDASTELYSALNQEEDVKKSFC